MWHDPASLLRPTIFVDRKQTANLKNLLNYSTWSEGGFGVGDGETVFDSRIGQNCDSETVTLESPSSILTCHSWIPGETGTLVVGIEN